MQSSASMDLSPGEVITDLECRTMKKVVWLLIPILILCYFAAFVDRTVRSVSNPTGSEFWNVLIWTTTCCPI